MIAAYAATKNLEDSMKLSIKSLVGTTEVDKIYCFVDFKPSFSDKRVEFVSTSEAVKYLDMSSKNMKSRWTYMACIRLTFHKLFDFDKILWLDCDTVVCEDLSPIWEINTTKPVAAVREKSDILCSGIPYLNSGVMLENLDVMRNGVGDKAINILNTRQLRFPDQDALNLALCGDFYKLKPRYNEFPATRISQNPAIVHYACREDYINGARSIYAKRWLDTK